VRDVSHLNALVELYLPIPVNGLSKLSLTLPLSEAGFNRTFIILVFADALNEKQDESETDFESSAQNEAGSTSSIGLFSGTFS